MKTRIFNTTGLNINGLLRFMPFLVKKPGRKSKNGTISALIFILISLPLLSMNQNIKAAGDTVPFNTIIAGGAFNISLTQGDEYKVLIENTNEAPEQVEASIKDGVLMLTERGLARNQKISVNIVTPQVEKIKLTGASTLAATNEISTPVLTLHLSGASKLDMTLNTGSLETRAIGAADINLSGGTGKHNIVMSGASQLRAVTLETDTTLVNISGASNARVWAKEMLDVKGSGASRVSHVADPNSRNVRLSGTASVNKITTRSKSSPAESLDTLKVRIGNRDLWVMDEKDNKRSKREIRRSFKNNWSGFELGINGFLTPDNKFDLGQENNHLKLRYPKSVVVNLNLFQQNLPIIKNNLGLITGIGLGFNNFRFDNQYIFIPNQEGLIAVREEELSIRKNKFTVTYVNVPILLEFQTHGEKQVDRFNIAGGIIVGARIGTHAKFVFDDNGRKKKEKTYNDFNMHPFRFDLTGRIGWGKLNLFATYSLNSLFKENRGPELYPFNVGMQLVSF